MKSWRIQIETPTLSRSHFQPRAALADRVGDEAQERAHHLDAVQATPLTSTQASSTKADTTREQTRRPTAA